MQNYKIRITSILAVILCTSCAITEEGKGYGLIEKKELAQALPHLEKSALEGSKNAAITVGWIYMQGYQVKRDITKAQYYYNIYKKIPSNQYDNAFTSKSANQLHALLMLNDNNIQNDHEASLIFRSNDNAESSFALLILARIYAFGVGEDKNISIAKQLYERAIKFDKSFASLNEYAWFLSVHPDAAFRDPVLALELIKKVIKQNASINALTLDTLAAAYAENNLFNDAVEAQVSAISKFNENAKGDDLEKIRSEFECRLTHYKQERVWRLESSYSPFGQKVLNNCS